MSKMTTKERQVRAALRRAGTRREALNKADKKLSEQTERALKRADGVVPMEEAARLVGLSRSTVYQVYLQTDGGKDADGKRSTPAKPRPKASGPQKSKRSADLPRPTQKADRGQGKAKAPAKAGRKKDGR